MSEIEYFFSCHSSYTYLGSARLIAIATAAGRSIAHRPMNLDQVVEACGSVAFRDRSLAYRNYFFNREIERWAEYRGIRTLGRRPTYHHHSPDLANCALVAALDAGHAIESLAHRLLEAHWADDADLADPHTLIELVDEQGFDGMRLVEAASSERVLERYAANTHEAIERGVFGSPTYVVDGDMFYGQDRLRLVERALRKPFANTWPPIR